MQGNAWQAPDEAQHGALFIILAAHLMPRFPPHYVVYQTEQWGHQVLAAGNRVWGPPHNGTARTDCTEVFRNAVEACPGSHSDACLSAQPKGWTGIHLTGSPAGSCNIEQPQSATWCCLLCSPHSLSWQFLAWQNVLRAS